MKSENFASTLGILRKHIYIHQIQTHYQLDLKWQIVFRNASKMFWYYLKRIILVLTVSIPFSLERAVFLHCVQT